MYSVDNPLNIILSLLAFVAYCTSLLEYFLYITIQVARYK